MKCHYSYQVHSTWQVLVCGCLSASNTADGRLDAARWQQRGKGRVYDAVADALSDRRYAGMRMGRVLGMGKRSRNKGWGDDKR
jgi:hypothetical protein